jgi:hypothetical protein
MVAIKQIGGTFEFCIYKNGQLIKIDISRHNIVILFNYNLLN